MEVLSNISYYTWSTKVHINNSYKITDRSEMKEILYAIQYKHPDCKVFKRSYDDLVREWVAHNRLYKWGIQQSKTKHVDFDVPYKWYEKIIYFILGI